MFGDGLLNRVYHITFFILYRMGYIVTYTVYHRNYGSIGMDWPLVTSESRAGCGPFLHQDGPRVPSYFEWTHMRSSFWDVEFCLADLSRVSELELSKSFQIHQDADVRTPWQKGCIWFYLRKSTHHWRSYHPFHQCGRMGILGTEWPYSFLWVEHLEVSMKILPNHPSHWTSFAYRNPWRSGDSQ